MIVRRRLARRLWALLLLGNTLAATGCGEIGTITPPTGVTDPQRIALLDHGRHTSLILPHPTEPAIIEWAYGDWHWYALGEQGLLDGVNALLWPSSAALGRYAYPPPLTRETVRRHFGGRIETVFLFDVSAAKVAALTANLESLFDDGRSQALVHNPRYRLDFVPHPDSYALGHSSNDVAAAWLRALGCTIDVVPTIAEWNVVSAGEPDTYSGPPSPPCPNQSKASPPCESAGD